MFRKYMYQDKWVMKFQITQNKKVKSLNQNINLLKCIVHATFKIAIVILKDVAVVSQVYYKN